MTVAQTPASAAPQPAAQAGRKPAAVSPQALFAALDQGIEPVPVSILYRLILLVVAVAMVLLPLVYLSLIAGLAWLVYFHATHSIGMFSAARGRGAIFILAIYLAPIIAGSIAVLFMLKPLFARRVSEHRPVSLSREAEPLLFEFVDRLCDAVGARRPERIDIDCNVNASASFRGGLWSLLRGKLVLTIGMPLAAGLSLRQFAGVLAHEFGHFAQGGAMRLTYVIRSINAWFAGVVYGRDTWDARLDAWVQEAPHIAVLVIVWTTKFFVWFSRRVLWALMWIGHAISCLMLRQMEYDADRYEARVAGSDGFVATMRQLPVIGVAYSAAMDDLRRAYSERRLVDDVPALVKHRLRKMPAEVVEKVHAAMAARKTGPFDTHPADADRIESATAEQAPGILHVEAPARVLFRDFSEACRRATLAHYEPMGPQALQQVTLVPTEQLLRTSGVDEKANQSLERFFGGAISVYRPVWVGMDVLRPPRDPERVLAKLRAARQEMANLVAGTKEAIDQQREAEQKLLNINRARVLTVAGFRIQPETFGLPSTDSAALQHAQLEAQRKQTAALARIEPFQEHARVRLESALTLILAEGVVKLKDPQRWREQTERLLEALVALQGQHGRLVQLRDVFDATAVLAQQLPNRSKDGVFIQTVLNRLREVNELMRQIRTGLKDTVYPFDHAQGERVTLGHYALAELPQQNDLGGVMGSAESMLENLYGLYFRIMARLADMACRIEQAAGLDAAS